MMSFFQSAVRQIRLLTMQSRLLTMEITAISRVPRPVPKMICNGVAIGSGFLGLLLTGKIEGALICAFFANLLMFTDQPGPLHERSSVLGLAAGFSALCGIAGAWASSSDVLVFGGTFGLAFLAGFIHGSVRGIDMIPRFAAMCFVAGAYLPVVNDDAILGVGVATASVLAAVALEDRVLRLLGRHTPPEPPLLLLMNYPGLRFSLAYGLAAVSGVALGQSWGDARPYWLTITTLLVMQPNHRTNMFRAVQRFLGTIAGVLAAFALISILPDAHHFSIIIILGLSMPFVWPLGYARNYAVGVAILSTWILLLLDLALPATEAIGAILAARLADTTAGCLLAIAGAFIYNETARDDRQGI